MYGRIPTVWESPKSSQSFSPLLSNFPARDSMAPALPRCQRVPLVNFSILTPSPAVPRWTQGPGIVCLCKPRVVGFFPCWDLGFQP